MTTREIVERATAVPWLFKDASKILRGREPDEEAAQALVDAYEAGEAPAWLVAHLLGCLRARSTYDVVRGILVSAPGSLAESYAGVAMVRIAGADARADPLDLMRRAQREAMRAGMVRLAPRTRRMLEARPSIFARAVPSNLARTLIKTSGCSLGLDVVALGGAEDDGAPALGVEQPDPERGR